MSFLHHGKGTHAETIVLRREVGAGSSEIPGRTTFPPGGERDGMSREELQRASDELRKASEATDDSELQARLYDHSNQLAKLADREHGPDHGRLDRHLNALVEMEADAEADATDHIETAREAITAFRETVEGV